LENEVETETGGEIDEEILRSVENVARFQYEDALSMPFAKVNSIFSYIVRCCYISTFTPTHADVLGNVVKKIERKFSKTLTCVG